MAGTLRERVDPMLAFVRVARVHIAQPQPDALLAILGEELRATLGYILFTVLVHDAAGGTLRRIFSTRPDVNPVGGTKPITESNWMRQVLQRGESYLGRTREDLKAVFFDHELLWSIGCGSVLNVPVGWNGKVLGSLNLLHEADWYDERDVPTARLFAQFSLPVFLVAQE